MKMVNERVIIKLCRAKEVPRGFVHENYCHRRHDTYSGAQLPFVTATETIDPSMSILEQIEPLQHCLDSLK